MPVECAHGAKTPRHEILRGPLDCYPCHPRLPYQHATPKSRFKISATEECNNLGPDIQEQRLHQGNDVIDATVRSDKGFLTGGLDHEDAMKFGLLNNATKGKRHPRTLSSSTSTVGQGLSPENHDHISCLMGYPKRHNDIVALTVTTPT